MPLERLGSSNQLRRTQSLNRFRLVSVSAPNKLSPSLERVPSGLEDQEKEETIKGTVQKIRVNSSRVAKRKLLLRKKIEELENMKITRHYT